MILVENDDQIWQEDMDTWWYTQVLWKKYFKIGTFYHRNLHPRKPLETTRTQFLNLQGRSHADSGWKPMHYLPHYKTVFFLVVSIGKQQRVAEMLASSRQKSIKDPSPKRELWVLWGGNFKHNSPSCKTMLTRQYIYIETACKLSFDSGSNQLKEISPQPTNISYNGSCLPGGPCTRPLALWCCRFITVIAINQRHRHLAFDKRHKDSRLMNSHELGRYLRKKLCKPMSSAHYSTKKMLIS